jgi:hypothetical protein
MECLFEVLIQLLGEAFLGSVLEFLAELIGRGVAWVFNVLTGRLDDPRRPPDDLRVARAILYQLMGVAAGFISLLIRREHMIRLPWLQVVGLVVTPLVMAAVMVQWGKFLAARQKARTPLNHFVCAYGFGLCYLLVRFFFAK